MPPDKTQKSPMVAFVSRLGGLLCHGMHFTTLSISFNLSQLPAGHTAMVMVQGQQNLNFLSSFRCRDLWVHQKEGFEAFCKTLCFPFQLLGFQANSSFFLFTNDQILLHKNHSCRRSIGESVCSPELELESCIFCFRTGQIW